MPTPTYTINGQASPTDSTLVGPPITGFDLSIQPREQVIDSSEIVVWSDGDLTYQDRSEAVIDHEGDANVQEIDQRATSGGSYENLTPDVASLTGTKLTRLSDGVSKIIYRTPRLTKYASIQITRDISQASRQFVQYTNGSLFRHMTEMLEPYMPGKTLTNTFMYMDYATQNWNLNPNFWLSHLDFSCLSVWNDSGQNQMGGTAITPRHILFNQHYQPYVGPSPIRRIRFKSWLTGEIHERRITSGLELGPWDYSEGAQGDIFIDVLDEPLPPEITLAKFLPPRFKSYTKRNNSYLANSGIPIIACDQFKRAHIVDWSAINIDSLFSAYTPTSALRAPLYADVVNGDSSSTAFGVINNQYILLSTWRFGGSGGGPGYSTPTVRSKVLRGLESLGSEYQIQDVDLSDFQIYDPYLLQILAYPSLVGYWRLSESPATYTPIIAIDEKGFRTGTYSNTIALASADSPFLDSDEHVPTFNGVDDFVEIPSIGSFPVWSIEAWVKRNGNQIPNCAVIADIYNGSSLNFTILFSSATQIMVGYHTRGTWCQSPPIDAPDALWFHVVGTFDGSTLCFYYNGSLASATFFPTASEGGGVGLRIGQRWDLPDRFKGNLSDVAVYNAPLTATEVLANYNQGIAA